MPCATPRPSRRMPSSRPPAADRLQRGWHGVRPLDPDRRPTQRSGQGRAVRAAPDGCQFANRGRRRERLALEPEIRDHGRRLSVPRRLCQMVHRRQCAVGSDLHGCPHRQSGRASGRFETLCRAVRAGQEPKVDAFWSISMYHIADGSFVDNPIKRYSIGDRTKGLTRAADGSLTITSSMMRRKGPRRRPTGCRRPRVAST
jgi:hypothetical protein